MSNCSLNVSTEDEKRSEQFISAFNYGYYYQVYTAMAIALWITGVPLNTINIIILTRAKMRNPTNFLLSVLAMSDIMFLTCRIIWPMVYFVVKTVHKEVTLSTLIFHYGGFLLDTSTFLISEWMNVTVGAWRFIAVTWPFQAKTLCSQTKANMVVVTIVLCAIVISIPHTFLWQLENAPYQCAVVLEEFPRKYNIPWNEIHVYILSILMTIPILLTIIITTGLTRSLYTSQKSNRTAVMLVVLMVNFLVANIPGVVLYITFFLRIDNILLYRNIFYILLLIEKNSTFFIYVTMLAKFRTIFFNFCKNANLCKNLFVLSSKQVPGVWEIPST